MSTKEKFEFSRGLDFNLRSAVQQAIGAASVCWTDGPAGIFDSERALEIAEALMKEIGRNLDHPWLGLATTKQLIDELAARAHIADSIGESWPNYRTVND